MKDPIRGWISRAKASAEYPKRLVRQWGLAIAKACVRLVSESDNNWILKEAERELSREEMAEDPSKEGVFSYQEQFIWLPRKGSALEPVTGDVVDFIRASSEPAHLRVGVSVVPLRAREKRWEVFLGKRTKNPEVSRARKIPRTSRAQQCEN